MRGFSNWVFLVPMLFFFIGYQAYPILRVLWISFTDYKYLRPEPAKWVGLLNYQNALVDPLMYTGLWRAFEFTLMFLPGTILLPLLLAVLIDRVTYPRLAAFYRIILLIPAVIPGAMIFVLWKWMYDFQIGPINYILVHVLHLFTERTAPQWLPRPPPPPPAGPQNQKKGAGAKPPRLGPRPRGAPPPPPRALAG